MRPSDRVDVQFSCTKEKDKYQNKTLCQGNLEHGASEALYSYKYFEFLDFYDYKKIMEMKTIKKSIAFFTDKYKTYSPGQVDA